jgi:cell division protein FtsA
LVISGGGSILDGMPELAEEMLQIPVRQGRPGGVGGMADMLRNANYSTATGLLLYAADAIGETEKVVPVQRKERTSVIQNIGGWFKEMF